MELIQHEVLKSAQALLVYNQFIRELELADSVAKSSSQFQPELSPKHRSFFLLFSYLQCNHLLSCFTSFTYLSV